MPPSAVALGGQAFRSLGAAVVLSLLICFVILVIVDLDRPGRGLIRVTQNSMISLQKSMEAMK